MFENLHALDIAVVAGYFVIVFIIAFYVTYKNKKREKNQSAGYFLGGRDAGWFVIGASLFASNIGSEHLIGLAGSGASGDFVAGQFEILASLILLILGWVFVPFYLRSGVFTMPEFLERRYNSAARSYLSWVSIFAYVVTKISVTIAAGGIVFTTMMGIDFWTGAVIIVLATGLYTVLGGLKAVIYTDMMQMFVLVGGAIAVTFYGLGELGGWSELTARTDEMYTSLWRPFSDPDFPWTGILFGAPILGVWYWCTDQFIVQRVLAAKNISNARKGTIFGGYLKLLPLFLFVIPGVVAYALSTGDNPAITFPLDTEGKTEYDAALPAIVMGILPAGLKGLVMAGLLAALMSSLSSVFNSCSTLFTFDIYKKYKPEATEKRLVVVGQIATVVLVMMGLAWIPFMKFIEGGLFQYLQSVQAYISPPIAAVFLLGIFYKRLNSKGAMAALFTGAAIGLLRLTMEVFKDDLTGFWGTFASMNFLHFALFLFAICSAVLVIVSIRSAPPKMEQIEAVTYSKGRSKDSDGNRKLDTALSIGLVLAVIALWIAFS